MACKVGSRPNRPNLYLRLWWRGRETWEATGLKKTTEHRLRLQRIADAVTAEIKARAFTPERYLYWFPQGRRLNEFRVSTPPTQCPEATTMSGYFPSWLDRYKTPDVRPSRVRDYRLHLTNYVLPHLGEVPLDALKTRHLRDLRSILAREGLSAKTVRNIIGSSLRSMVRDAIADELLTVNPFVGLAWERTIRKKPDPFTGAERDKILAWFATKRRWYFPFVFTLFHVGLRPSEAAALRLGDLDLGRATLDVTKSRHLGAEHPPKTKRSERTIKLPPAVTGILRELVPLRVNPDAYLFTNAKHGGPIDQNEFAKTHWQAALRAVGTKARKFYATRSTFISLTVPRTRNLKALADYCGTSVAMIEQHYGRYLGEDPDWLDERIEQAPKLAAAGSKPVTFAGSSLVGAENPLRSKASPTGFEPVLPT